MADVFLSYASADREKARKLGEILAGRGYTVWWDRTIPPGRMFDEIIQEALSVAKCVVVLWSTASVGSNWVKTEAAEAAGRNILVPVLIENVSLPIEFKRIQSANLSSWNGDSEHPEFRNLVTSIKRLLDAVPHQKPTASGAETPSGWGARSRSSRSFRSIATAAALGLIVVAGGAYWYFQKGTSSGVEQVTPQGKIAAPAQPTHTPIGTAQSPAGTHQPAVLSSKRINLLAKEHGGQVVAAPNQAWGLLINDDAQNIGVSVNKSGPGVFAFKDERSATFDTFKVLIPGSNDRNLNEFELLAGNESPTGHFESIGTFRTQNVRLKSPYQEFKFAPVKAKYLKVQPLSSYRGNLTENVWASISGFQLFGTLE